MGWLPSKRKATRKYSQYVPTIWRNRRLSPGAYSCPKVFKDEEYLNVVLPDELKFIDRPNCKMLPLDLVSILDRETIE
jgi:hypothetical protein